MKKLEDALGLTKHAIINDYAELKSLRNIAKKYKTDHSTVKRMFKRFEIPYRERNKENHKLPLNEEYFKNVNSDMLYWIGFLTADGCIFKNYIRLTLGEKDYNHLVKFKTSVGAIQHKISKSRNMLSKINSNWNDVNCYSVALCSNNMVKDVSRFGVVPRKTFKITFPKMLFNSENVNAYCRGYFDGDGSWCFHKVKSRPNRKPQLTFSLRGTENFLYEFNRIMVKYAELPQRCYDRKISSSDNIGSLTYIGNNICKKIGKWLYSDVTKNKGIYLDRKFSFFNSL